MKACRFLAIPLAIGLLSTLGIAHADTIYDLGSSYTLTSDFIAEDGTNTYDVTLVINTAGFTKGPAYIDAVSIGVPNTAIGALDAAPGGINLWTVFDHSATNANGCNTKSKAAFICAQLVGPTSTTPTGTTNGQANVYTWMFDVTLPAGQTLSTDTLGSHVKALYFGKTSNDNVGQTSEDITIQNGPQDVVPEPASVVLLGTVVSLTALTLRRRFQTGS